MFDIDADLTIHLTRGDIANLDVGAKVDGTDDYMFRVGDIVRINVFVKGQHDNIVLTKDVPVLVEASVISIFLSSEDTKIGDIINKPADYWYEVELNPDAMSQTIIGYDKKGPKVFRLYPEGDDNNG